MRLPKHKMTKTKNLKAAKKTAKHKPIKALMQTSTNSSAQLSMEIDDDESAVNGKTPTVDISSNKSTPKTKEEKKSIREARRNKNFAANHYKVRAGNVSGKHGPRAINRVSLG